MGHYIINDCDVVSFLNIYTRVNMIVYKHIFNLDVVRLLNVYGPILTILDRTICDFTRFGRAFKNDGSFIGSRTSLNLNILKNKLGLLLVCSSIIVDDAAL